MDKFPNTQSLEPSYMEQGWTNKNSAISVITKTSWWLMAGPNFHPVPCFSSPAFPALSCFPLLLCPLQSISLLLPSLAFSFLLLLVPCICAGGQFPPCPLQPVSLHMLLLPSPACTLYLWWSTISPCPLQPVSLFLLHCHGPFVTGGLLNLA